MARGVANAVTGAPMREDTGFLFGSVTKVMTTMLVLQQVERGVLDLDEPVVRSGRNGAARNVIEWHGAGLAWTVGFGGR